MSDHVEEKLLAMLNGPLESPYGNPIPGLEELGGPLSQPGAFRDGVLSLPDAVALGAIRAASDAGRPVVETTSKGDGASLLIRRLGERLQIDVDLMRQLQGAGMVPGSRVSAERTPTGYLVNVLNKPLGLRPSADTESHGIALLADVARHVFVEVA